MTECEIPVISTTLIKGLADALDDAPAIDESCESILALLPSYDEFFNEIEMQIIKDDKYDAQKTKESQALQQQRCDKVSMLIASRFAELKNLTTLVELKSDCNELLILKHLLNEELCDIRQKYGDNVLEITDNIIDMYINVYKFRIVNVAELDNHVSLCIKFVIDGKVIARYPVQIGIEKNMHKVVDVDTNIYSRDKLITWLNKNNRNITDLLCNLHKTLIDILK